MRKAMEGIRIIDAGTVQAGPFTSRILADMGAEVIRVESRIYPEGIRLYGPPDDTVGEKFWEQGNIYHEQHRNKMCVTLELNMPQGVEIFKRLVRISDIVIDSRPPRVMRGFGLGYEALAEVNPSIILLTSIGYGHYGPYTDFRSYGMPAEAMTGIASLQGYEGGPPRRGTIPYPDHVCFMLGTFALLAALEHRRRTGKGQWIDLAHYEAAILVTGQALMDYSMNKRIPPRLGNHDPACAPHNVYRCAGLDKWVAIVVRDDAEWQRLCEAIGREELICDPRFSSFLDRKRNEAELDAEITRWTSERDQYEAMRLLQCAGIPAGPVLSSKGLLLDPQLRERGFWEWVKHHPEQEGVGTRPFPGAMWKMSKTPGGIERPAPLLGEHNEPVLRGLLGLSDEEIQDLKLIRVIGNEPENKQRPVGGRASPAVLREYKKVLERDADYKEILGIADTGKA